MDEIKRENAISRFFRWLGGDLKEIGATFVKVLEDSGVYKTGAEGRAAFNRFINHFISTIKQ